MRFLLPIKPFVTYHQVPCVCHHWFNFKNQNSAKELCRCINKSWMLAVLVKLNQGLGNLCWYTGNGGGGGNLPIVEYIPEKTHRICQPVTRKLTFIGYWYV
jgi:hypothetical protein